jgi:hypothetical protein
MSVQSFDQGRWAMGKTRRFRALAPDPLLQLFVSWLATLVARGGIAGLLLASGSAAL